MELYSWKKAIALGLLAALAIACDKTDRSFSLLAENTGFKQSDTYVQKKIDILWVVDNSSSMTTSQANLVNNFSSFVSRFQTLGYDFHMAVITTDAYIGKYNVSQRSFFHDGSDYRAALKDGKYEKQTNASNQFLCDYAGAGPVHVCDFVANPTDTYRVLPVTYSGVQVMTPATLDLTNVFITNASQGILGSSDERPFESFYDALQRAGNAGFRRPDAFLSIIIVSDEDDWSASTYKLPSTYHSSSLKDGTNPYYSGPESIPVSFYKGWLDTFAGAGNYSVSAITIDNSLFTVPNGTGGTVQKTCREILLNDPSNPNASAQRLGVRIMDLANQTKGVVGSICGNFADSLSNISNKVLELTASYHLDREPIISTIVVTVDGVVLPNDATNGWTYDAATQTIYFHGTGIPPAGSNVLINYDPTAAKG